MSLIPQRPRRVLATAVVVLLASACTDGSTNPDSALAQCKPDRLKTVATGRLTLSTGAVTRAPWVTGGAPGTSGDPRQGTGYDAAVGFALAERLGYAADQVAWVGTPFFDAIAAGPKPFDVNINQATVKPERAADVDLTEPYYVMRQAVVTLRNRPAATARTLADLEDDTFAVVDGSTAAVVVEEQVDPATPPVRHPDLDAVRGAVSDRRQEALVVDFVTAMQLDQDETRLVDGTMVGLLPRGDEPAEEYALVLEKGSPLTECVDAALAALRADGTLDRLEQRWLVDEPGYRLLS